MSHPLPQAIKDRIVGLAMDGKQPAEIYQELGGTLKLDTIHGVLHRAKRASGGQPIPSFRDRRSPPVNEQTFRLSVETLAALKEHAARRQIRVRTLVNRIVTTIAHDDLVDAVLDDRGQG